MTSSGSRTRPTARAATGMRAFGAASPTTIISRRPTPPCATSWTMASRSRTSHPTRPCSPSWRSSGRGPAGPGARDRSMDGRRPRAARHRHVPARFRTAGSSMPGRRDGPRSAGISWSPCSRSSRIARVSDGVRTRHAASFSRTAPRTMPESGATRPAAGIAIASAGRDRGMLAGPRPGRRRARRAPCQKYRRLIRSGRAGPMARCTIVHRIGPVKQWRRAWQSPPDRSQFRPVTYGPRSTTGATTVRPR